MTRCPWRPPRTSTSSWSSWAAPRPPGTPSARPSRPASRSSRANKELLAKQGRAAGGGGTRGRRAAFASRPPWPAACRCSVRSSGTWAPTASRPCAASSTARPTTSSRPWRPTAASYDDVLREAQARGYAEADPSSDVEGLDAAYKLTLLARLAFDGWLDVTALRRSIPVLGTTATPGITGVTRAHLGRRCPPRADHQARGPRRAQPGRPGPRRGDADGRRPSPRPWGPRAGSPTSSRSTPTRWVG